MLDENGKAGTVWAPGSRNRDFSRIRNDLRLIRSRNIDIWFGLRVRIGAQGAHDRAAATSVGPGFVSSSVNWTSSHQRGRYTAMSGVSASGPSAAYVIEKSVRSPVCVVLIWNCDAITCSYAEPLICA